MTKVIRLLLAASVIFALAACVSTTTSTGTTTGDDDPSAKPDDKAAAQQYYELGARYYRNGNYELAVDRLQRSIGFDSSLAISESTLALTYVALDNPRLADEHYKRAVKLAPKDFDVRNGYAVFLCRDGQYDEAREQFDKAISFYDNDNAEVMYSNAGVCMANKPDYAAAEQYFRQALQLRPGYGEALLQLCSLKHKEGVDLQARAFCQRYMAGNAAGPGVLFLMIEIEKQLGDDRAATDLVNQLFRDYPSSPEANYLRTEGQNR